jgi:C-terminal processing protease CtpA/Prc
MMTMVFVLLPFLAFASSQNLAGVGLALDKSGTQFIKIGSILQGSPADKVPQLQPGVVIRSIYDGKRWVNLKGTSMEKAVDLIRGKSGTLLILRTSSSDSGPTMDIPLQRRPLELPKSN